MQNGPIISSILDTDTYKLTMAQAVFLGKLNGIAYCDLDATYTFFNRDNIAFPENFAEALTEQLSYVSLLSLTSSERFFLEKACPFLKSVFLDWLQVYRFDPSEVTVVQHGSSISITIEGPWHRTILWEVIILALVSELYYKIKSKSPSSNYRHKMLAKARMFHHRGIKVADFGTRRRFSLDVQDDLVYDMVQNCSTFVGTSNVALAMKYNVKPIGTQAHEWISAHGALFGYPLANRFAMQSWVDVYRGNLGIALSDTFTTDVFFA